MSRTRYEKARSIAITHMGGQVFTVAEEPSDQSVLWAELFGTRERKFLRELLTSKIVNFTLQDTYQIFVRVLFHSQANLNAASNMRRGGKFVLMLHSLEGDLTSSWTWSKFIRPFYRHGFSVLLVDLPGFGKSTVSRMAYCPTSRWKEYDHHIISKILEELGIPKCHICAVGTGCGILFRMFQRAPHRLEQEHFLLNPELDRDELFAHVGIDPPPGAPPGWLDRVREKQQKACMDLMRTSNAKLWVMFDRGISYGTDDARQNELHQGNWQQQYDTHVLLTNAAKNPFVGANTVITEVMRADICDARLGQKVEVRALIPSRNLKASVSRYFAKVKNVKWAELFVPQHKKRTNLNWRNAHEIQQSDDDDSDEDLGASRQSSQLASLVPPMAHTSKLPQTRALALMPPPDDSIVEHRSSTTVGTDLDPEFLRIRRALEERMDLQKERMDLTTAASNAESSKTRSTRTGKLFRSKSETSTRDTKKESALLFGANFARKLLKSRGATSSGQPAAQTRRKKDEIDWSQAPFEHDLSYGVRKKFMDAFENSIVTYKEEEQARIDKHQAFKIRTAVHQRNFN